MAVSRTVTAEFPDGLLAFYLDMKNEFKEEMSGNRSSETSGEKGR